VRLAAALGVGLLLLAALGVGEAAAAPFEEPVSVTATAPPSVGAGVPFPLQVEVAAEAGALDIAAAPLRLRVKFEPECGGSFAGTEGPVAIDRVLPAPAPGTAYSQTINASITLAPLGPETVCAFLEDAQERQFATDGEEELTVVPGCTTATQTLAKLKRSLKKLDRRIHELRQRIRHAGSAKGANTAARAKKHRAEVRHLKKLRKRRHRLAHRKRAAKHLVTISCGSRG
jgi:hypothetical protein